MTTLRKLPFLIMEGLRGLWTNRLMSLSSIGVLGVCLLLISNAALISANIDVMISQIGRDDAIVVYLQDDIPTAEAENFAGKLLELNNVSAVRYVSSEEALGNWKEILSDYPDLFEGIDENFLPASYSISIVDLEKINETIYQLESMEEISSVRQMAELIDRLISIQKTVSTTLYAIVAILLVVSLFIIANTIKLAMFSRRKEISIMKFVGGTDAFIQIPFVVEGFVIGLFAALVAFLAQWYVYDFVIARLVTSIDFIEALPFSEFCLPLCLWLPLAGAVTGVFGSAVSMHRYLKV